MVTLLRLDRLFETLSTVARLQTKSRTQESQVRVRAALLIYLIVAICLVVCLFFVIDCFVAVFLFQYLSFITVTFFLIPNHHLCLSHVNEHVSG